MYQDKGQTILNLKENKAIPKDPANRDFQEFQKWLTEGNKPIPEYVPNDCINMETFEVDENCVFQKIKEQKRKEILQFEKQRFQKICDEYDYNDLADIQFCAQKEKSGEEEGTEAQDLENWWYAYDSLIWDWINNDLQVIATLDKLLSLDMKAIEQQIFDQSIQTAPLPSGE
ncbi:hypothetical protein [Persephonella sp.]|uniref:hypothetical protein n=1 Tax=Persephonella sp. TaxID=2060922 RepID=UPI0026194254|nr:hypothetical protein [Persephonella sp.]